MRIGNPEIPVLFEDREFVIGKGRVIREGSDVTIIATGSATRSAMEAAENLAKKNISVRLIGMPTVMPIDQELVIESAKITKGVITVEEHYQDGGLGTIVSEVLSSNYPTRVKRIGIPKVFASSGPYEELLAYYGLDAQGIESKTIGFLSE
jgi:transketolase